METNVLNHMRKILARAAWLAVPIFFAGFVTPMPAQPETAVDRLRRIVNEEIVMRPTQLGAVKVIITEDQRMWTEMKVPFNDLRPEPRRLAESLGWQPNELVRIRISREFDEIRILQRDVANGQ
jgi:hypothetical protein